MVLYSGTGGNPRDSTVSWGLRGGEELWDSSGVSGTGGESQGLLCVLGTQGRGGTLG